MRHSQALREGLPHPGSRAGADPGSPSDEPTRFVVVTWSGAVPIHLSPRGQRTEHLVNALSAHGSVERVGGDNIPRWLAGNSERTTSSWYRQLARTFVYSVLIDKYEISVRRALGSWQPSADAAVLVAYPCSHLIVAARKLARKGIPYIVDIGDPWILTNPYPEGGRIRKMRARRQERQVWRKATAAIVTTETQGDALSSLFPHLRVLVRPNGYAESEDAGSGGTGTVGSRNPRSLHLVHYGSLYGERVDFEVILRRLAESGHWDNITLRQHGSDWEDALAHAAPYCTVDRRAPITWPAVVAGAQEFDAAIVIGWRNPAQMPSKTVQYLTLPIPRIALTTARPDDALDRYTKKQPGWVQVTDEDEHAAAVVARHVAREWDTKHLAAPTTEAWEAVELRLAEFVIEVARADPSKAGYSRDPTSSLR
jgi:hypothetical protein